ncbi:MAG: tRNA (adenosine(37)-N6)-threonylcarbamoyltransferase complex ATPase subunit type 1 TsaE [Mollicutes bacterium]|nr:tRNA (adenosine(37)-N6)-threonylcarbamoyltransferase complex ATPase subunit type 1 TsaE [Mollicutes bacterium]
MKYEFISKSKEETQKLGAFIAKEFLPGDVVLLKGDLGAGKTTLTGGVAKALDIKDDVISPTFNIMKCYFKGKLPLYHIDAYRLENQNIELGLDEYIEGDGVCFIEWPQYIEPLLPDETLSITLKNIGGDNRSITLEGNTAHFVQIICSVKGAFHV